MADFTFHNLSVSVSASFLVNPIVLPLVPVENTAPGDQFIQCVAKNGALTRLLVDNRFLEVFASKDVALRSSNILVTLKKAKDDAWNTHVGKIDKANWKTGRHTAKGVRPKVLAFPTLVEITAPQTPTVESITVTVRLNKPNKALVLKLTPPVLEYLRAVVTEQLDTGDFTPIQHARSTKVGDDRVVTGVKNLYWSYVRSKYRAVHQPPDADDGTKPPSKTAYITSKESAITFIETGDKPTVSAIGEDMHSSGDEDRPPPGPRSLCIDSDEDEGVDDQMSE